MAGLGGRKERLGEPWQARQRARHEILAGEVGADWALEGGGLGDRGWVREPHSLPSASLAAWYFNVCTPLQGEPLTMWGQLDTEPRGQGRRTSLSGTTYGHWVW